VFFIDIAFLSVFLKASSHDRLSAVLWPHKRRNIHIAPAFSPTYSNIAEISGSALEITAGICYNVAVIFTKVVPAVCRKSGGASRTNVIRIQEKGII
jgi:hypothetical protein